ncbi:glycosyltransferase family 4 protein [Thermithiobacillus plumbiphilus]|uniref:Glycosyltransferase family 4 protein n=1 Tax=Thermithiobacillus plumbiphilus TaxID=1729899 RepID=A0ABU9D635_9PROT
MKKKRKVLLLLNSLLSGGAERHVLSLVDGLDRDMFKLSLAYLKRQENLLPQVNAERLDYLFCCEARNGFDWAALRKLIRHIRSTRPEVVMCTNQYSMLYGYLARLLAGYRFELIEVFHTTEMPKNANQWHQRLYHKLFSKCDKVIFVSKNQQEYWLAQGLRLKQHQYIHNGVDTEHFRDSFSKVEKVAIRNRYGFAESDYLVGVCAAFRPEKSHLDFLKALRRVRDLGLPAKALLIGDGPTRLEIEAYIRQSALEDAVVITGFQSDVRPLIAICDVMVLTSIAVETFSIAVLESMALGKPVISTAIGGVPEQITHGATGFLFEKGDVDALVELLLRLSDKPLREEMGRSARATVVERFTLDRMLAAYEDILMEKDVLTSGISRACST